MDRIALYCWPCRQNHTFSVEEVERLVYWGQAAALHDPELDRTERDLFLNECLRDMLEDTQDVEIYGDFVDGRIELREQNAVIETQRPDNEERT